GALWGDRWHGRALTSPRQVRSVLVYVFGNFRKHVRDAAEAIDPRSSAAWFDGWRDIPSRRLLTLRSREGPPVARPTTWLARIGWRRALPGLLCTRESPAGT